MTGHKRRECPKCRGERCPANNCMDSRYLYNRDLKCGCKKEEIIYKNKFTDTHCCKCKKSFCIYKLNNDNQCSSCRKGKAKQIFTNNGSQWKNTDNIDSQKSIQQWNEFMRQERSNQQWNEFVRQERSITSQNQPSTSNTHTYKVVKQSPVNTYYPNCRNCGKSNKESKGHMGHFDGPLCHKCDIKKENFKRYGTTGKVTSCEICGISSDDQQNMQRGYEQIYFVKCDVK